MTRISRIHNGLVPLALAALLAASAVQAADPVPPNYAALYGQLQTALTGFEATLDASQPPQPHHVTYATELTAADANRGPALLQPATMDSVRLCLDRFQQMGISGVTVALSYPLFDPAFPDNQDYVAFYQQVAREIHSRGMKLCVEDYVVLTGTPFTSIQWDWSGYTVDSLAVACHAMAQEILDEVQPDYLDVGTESDTEANATGMASLSDPQTFAHFVHVIVDGLDKGTTKVCAGMGAWENFQQAELLAQEPGLDALAVHLYPLDPTSLQNVLAIGSLAHSSGKGLILDECWLYKEPPSEGIVQSSDPNRRSKYGFWEPLDQMFLECAAKLAQADGLEYASPFNSQVFFAYLVYTPALDTLPISEVLSMASQAQAQAMQADTFTATGETYASLVAQDPGGLAASFTYSPGAPTDATSVTFTASASGGSPPYAYAWDFCGTGGSGQQTSEALAAGTCAVTLTVTDASGATATVTQSVQVGYSLVIAQVAWGTNPARLKVSGSGFESGCQVLIGGAPAPATAWKSDDLLVAKGVGLKAMVPMGTAVQVTVKAPDGRSSAPVAFTR